MRNYLIIISFQTVLIADLQSEYSKPFYFHRGT